MSDRKDSSKGLGDFLKRFSGAIVGLIALATAISGFITLLQGNTGIVTIICFIVGVTGLWLVCLYYFRFWKPELEDKSQPGLSPVSDEQVLTQQKKEKQRKRVRFVSKIGVFVILLLVFAGWVIWQHIQNLPSKDQIVLVAKFEGPDQEGYRVTETIIENLEDAARSYPNLKVERFEKPMENIANAREMGKQRKAAIVIWGKYGKTKEVVPISIHFEVMNPPKYYPELGEEVRGKFQTTAIAQIESFQLQIQLSEKMAYLTLFTLGTSRYAAEDWNQAIPYFNDALDQVKKQPTIAELNQSIVYFYRGFAYYNKKEDDRAIADYDKAIQLNPQYVDAYNNRGIAYRHKKEYDRAIADYDKAIQLNPKYALAYYNRGVAYYYKKEYDLAIADYDKAIQLNPKFALAYYKRSLAYAYSKKGDKKKAIEDFMKALKLAKDPSFKQDIEQQLKKIEK